MIPIEYKKGDATNITPRGDNIDVIAHVCNNRGVWGAGFTSAISKRWKEPERSYRSTENYRLGTTDICVKNDIPDHLVIANMVAQDGYKSIYNPKPVQYWALASCFVSLGNYIVSVLPDDTWVHMPRIGCGLGGGDWNDVENIIKYTLSDCNLKVIIYDY